MLLHSSINKPLSDGPVLYYKQRIRICQGVQWARHQGHIRELSQGDAASCATQEATNLDGTAFFGPLRLTSAFANERRSSAVYWCVYVMHERIPSPGKVSDWLILQLRWTSRTTLVFAITVLDSKGTHGFKLVTRPIAEICTRHAQSNVVLIDKSGKKSVFRNWGINCPNERLSSCSVKQFIVLFCFR